MMIKILLSCLIILISIYLYENKNHSCTVTLYDANGAPSKLTGYSNE